MAFTYDITTDIGKVRRNIGDTDSATALLQDDEIQYYLDSANDNIYLASALAAQAISAEFSRKADTTVETVSVKYSQRAAQYASLSQRLRQDAKRLNAPNPVITGISEQAIEDQRADTDRVREKFYMDRFSNPQNDVDETRDGGL